MKERSLNISISGVMGSGKTTLAKKLSARLNWEYIPESLEAKRYLKDLFSETSRWALEIQFGFLVNKATVILEQLKKNNNYILDRTLQEDTEIFAAYFYEHGYIDARGYDTFKSLAEHYSSIIPPPDLILYCDCSLAISEIRIKKRNRDFQKLYPPNHIEDIYSRYGSWKNNQNDIPFYIINSEKLDFRDDNTINSIVEDLIYILNRNINQINLFDYTNNRNINLLSEQVPYLADNKPSVLIKKGDYISSAPPFPYAYIAAPFTSIAQKSTVEKKLELFDAVLPHGVIPSGDTIRNLLLSIAKILKGWGINSIIPHRDVNEWGKKQLNSVEVFKKCYMHVKGCDLFIGILGESLGAHLEYGIALGQSIPTILIDCDEISYSFLSKGINYETAQTHIIHCRSIKDIPFSLSKINLSELIRSF